MDLEIVRRIRGNVHGTVDVTALEDRVIDHPVVQRLRRIRQLAFLSFVFPGATHSRFEHSLGVMQLAGVTWQKMKANQQRLANTCGRYPDFAATELGGVGGLVHGLLAPTFPVMDAVFGSAYALQVLRLAGLLHDVGHPPFSHSGERFLPSYKELLAVSRGRVPAYLVAYLEETVVGLAAEGRDPARTAVRHEVYTLLLVDRLLSEVNAQAGALQAVEPRDVVSVLNPAVAPAPGSPLAAHGLSRLCHELISGEVDIDRMDYLLRDSRECGVVYGIFDATRIQDSLALYLDPRDRGLHLAISYSGLAAFEDYLRARHSMYLQLYFHKTSVAAEAMMQRLARMLGGWTLPADLDAYVGIDEYNIEGTLRAAAAERLAAGGAPRARFEALLGDLLRNRRLWKRVFEGTAPDPAMGRARAAEAEQVMDQAGVTYERVSSASSLTTFRPRREHEISGHYLRLIKKDDYQCPRVEPIEDHTALVASDSSVNISRIYVEDGVAADGERVPDKVKRLLLERLPRR